MNSVVKKENKKNFINKNLLEKVLISISSIAIGILFGMLIMIILGYNPANLFVSIWSGTFGSLQNFGNFLSALSWLSFIGFAMMISLRAGLFNIGISAQMVGGGLAGYLFAALVNIPGRIGLLFSLLIPILVGVSIALLIAFLKNKFGIHEVVSSIMLNWSIFWIYRYFKNPINASYLFPGNSIVPIDILQNNSLRAEWLTDIFNGSTINLGIIILIFVVPIIWFLYNKTSFGIKQNIIGNSKTVSDYVGINSDVEIYKAMALSGAFAGLAGSVFFLGTNQSLISVGSDLLPQAFNGITISLIGFNSPIGVFFGAIFVALFENSKIFLAVYSNKEIANLIVAIIVWLFAISNYFIIYKPQDKIIQWIKEGEKYDDFDNEKENKKTKSIENSSEEKERKEKRKKKNYLKKESKGE